MDKGFLVTNRPLRSMARYLSYLHTATKACLCAVHPYLTDIHMNFVFHLSPAACMFLDYELRRDDLRSFLHPDAASLDIATASEQRTPPREFTRVAVLSSFPELSFRTTVSTCTRRAPTEGPGQMQRVSLVKGYAAEWRQPTPP